MTFVEVSGCVKYEYSTSICLECGVLTPYISRTATPNTCTASCDVTTNVVVIDDWQGSVNICVPKTYMLVMNTVLYNLLLGTLYCKVAVRNNILTPAAAKKLGTSFGTTLTDDSIDNDFSCLT